METRQIEDMDSSPDKVIPPENFEDLIARLRDIFQSDKVNIDYVKSLMSAYKSDRSEWKKFAKFDRNRYTRNLVDTGNGKYNLIMLCWNESQGSSIHSHANSHCFMTVLDGTLQEEFYEWPTESEEDAEMTAVGTNTYNKGQTAYISDELGLHRVENPSHSDRAISLHLYSPPFDECECFDQKTGHCTKSKVTFWSKFGKRTPFGRAETAMTPENN
ncbi:cysteine dioxygenase type 1-like [Haliotis rufescens]|uniref:cysteine dioxygenase type 1-like n=1 Tax=Haliotis rufescens TaxID=6454 RepID=UPI001EB0AA11|nr:cysteine dioxygenase type 1-like [Haliotis rufescens]